MDKPIGRDRLGRLVYEDDRVTFQDDKQGCVSCWYSFNDKHEVMLNILEEKSETWRDVESYKTEVIFDKSPKHTNYERYFADLGTLDEVAKAWDDCEGLSCLQCPFDGWNTTFKVGSPVFSCSGFCKWLEQEATI